MRRLTSLLFFTIIVSIYACKRTSSSEGPVPTSETTLPDIAYGDHPMQKMDVYLPENRNSNTRIIVFIHGGGWFSGDKSDAKDGATYFQQQGYVFISINYRLTRTPENNIHPAQMQDIGKALGFIESKNHEWNLSDSRIIFYGVSSGAHLAMLYGYKYDDAKKVKAVVSLEGPTDLTDSSSRSNNLGEISVEELIESFIGAKLSDNPKAWQDASPINFISSTSPPTFFIHGTNDHIVPYEQSVNAYDKFKEAGVTTELETLNGVDHDLVGINWNEVLIKIQNFANTTTP